MLSLDKSIDFIGCSSVLPCVEFASYLGILAITTMSIHKQVAVYIFA